MNGSRSSFALGALLVLAHALLGTPPAAPARPPETPLKPEEAGPEKERLFAAGEAGYHTFRIPSLVVAPGGTLLALCEGRRHTAGDAGDVDLVFRRSANQGATWGPIETLWDDGANTCGNPCPVVDRQTGVICLLMTWNRGDDTESAIISQHARESRRVFLSRSTDQGLTWSRPEDITAQVKLGQWTWYVTGPGAGIQVQHGPHAGRLVVPCDHVEARTRRYGSHVIYSDDHGQTWKRGGSAPEPQVNECEVVELAKGRLLLNMRNFDSAQPTRQVAWSEDGGETWINQRHDPELIDPNCQASLRRFSWADSHAPGILLFSNPASSRRERMTVRASFDDGRTWPNAREIEPGPSAYSCLCVLPDRRIGLLYETGLKSPYEGITLARFPIGRLAADPTPPPAFGPPP